MGAPVPWGRSLSALFSSIVWRCRRFTRMVRPATKTLLRAHSAPPRLSAHSCTQRRTCARRVEVNRCRDSSLCHTPFFFHARFSFRPSSLAREDRIVTPQLTILLRPHSTWARHLRRARQPLAPPALQPTSGRARHPRRPAPHRRIRLRPLPLPPPRRRRPRRQRQLQLRLLRRLPLQLRLQNPLLRSRARSPRSTA